jgi:predicted lipoprotein with Yx(FWY)xxD motif
MNARVARYGGARRAASAVTTAFAVALMTVTALAPSAVAHAAKKENKTVMVVEVVNRAPYGKMLATVGGASLYTTPAPCTGGCLSIWPPLLIPKGKKIPTGVSGLATAKLAHHRRQISYNGKRLYTFYADRSGDVTGNGVGGFSVATAP